MTKKSSDCSTTQERHSVAVLISDVHYSLKTLALADAAMRQAIDKAAELRKRFIVAGDLHDTKANMRGECVRAMIDVFSYARSKGVDCDILIGNHCLINEKSKEHSLEFLKPYANVIDTPRKGDLYYTADKYFIPYQHDAKEFERILSTIPKGTTVICHQGVTDAESGEYAFDKSAVDKSILADYRVISGHYHKAQDIKCGPPRKGAVGLMSYIGTPYTITFAEANDGLKGFQILYDDGLLEHVPTNLRKHVIAEFTLEELDNWDRLMLCEHPMFYYKSGDLLWIKVRGPTLELDLLSKDNIKLALSLDSNNFKLDKLPTDAPKLAPESLQKKTNWEVMDSLIDVSGESITSQTALKALARKVMT